MVHTNLGPEGGCPRGYKNNKQRAFCCPEWGSPDPATCKWHGKGGQCYGQCDDNEILMLDDDSGGATHCDSGLRKTWCCHLHKATQPSKLTKFVRKVNVEVTNLSALQHSATSATKIYAV
jgi:hypothetical protein